MSRLLFFFVLINNALSFCLLFYFFSPLYLDYFLSYSQLKLLSQESGVVYGYLYISKLLLERNI